MILLVSYPDSPHGSFSGESLGTRLDVPTVYFEGINVRGSAFRKVFADLIFVNPNPTRYMYTVFLLGPWQIMLFFPPIMLLSTAPNSAYYAC